MGYFTKNTRAPWAIMKNSLSMLRANYKWSQADIADKLDVSRQTINAIETGRYDPSLPLAFKIARLFDKQIEEIFTPNGTLPNKEAKPSDST